jgi:hypothetical protein
VTCSLSGIVTVQCIIFFKLYPNEIPLRIAMVRGPSSPSLCLHLTPDTRPYGAPAHCSSFRRLICFGAQVPGCAAFCFHRHVSLHLFHPFLWGTVLIAVPPHCRRSLTVLRRAQIDYIPWYVNFRLNLLVFADDLLGQSLYVKPSLPETQRTDAPGVQLSVVVTVRALPVSHLC